MKTNYHKKLDNTLKLIVEGKFGIIDEKKEYNWLEDDGEDYSEILSKLIKDGFIKAKTSHSMYEIELPYIETVEGGIFFENGGYLGQKNRQTRSKRFQTIVTVAIALGSLSAIGLLILEWQKYHANCICY